MNTKDQELKQEFIQEIESQIRFKKKAIAAFKEDLDTDPFRAFDWSEDAIEAAATIRNLTGILEWINDELNKDKTAEIVLSEIKEALLLQVVDAARFQSNERTTNVAASMLNRKLLAAKAEFAQNLTFWINRASRKVA